VGILLQALSLSLTSTKYRRAASIQQNSTIKFENGVGELLSYLCSLLRNQHLWLVNRMGYSYILIGVQDLQCYDETCDEEIEGNDLHELGKAFILSFQKHSTASHSHHTIPCHVESYRNHRMMMPIAQSQLR
jgi:hypothetical protein